MKRNKNKKDNKMPEEYNMDQSEKALIIGIISLIVLFSIFFVGYGLISRGPAVKTIQQLHDDNLKGKLKPDEGYIYNGHSFVKAQGMWFTQVQRFRTTELYNVQFHYGPRELEGIPLSGNVSNFKDFNGTYVAFDPTAEKQFAYTALASGELSINLAQVFKMTPVAACTRNETVVCYTRPIVNCSTSVNPVIYMEKADKPAVVRENEACIRIMGNGTDLVKATDRLVYQWFGIMS